MKQTLHIPGPVLTIGIAVGTTTAIVASLTRYVRHEIARRGYPSWEECHCDFKEQTTIFQVWHSDHQQRGETIISQEWGLYLVRPARWLRRFLHYSAQIMATLNLRGNYVERLLLSPQETRRFAALLHAGSSSEEADEEPGTPPSAYVTWRSEVLHFPRYLFDACTRRIYPAHITPERLSQAEPLPVIWDPESNLPIPTEGTLLETPTGTRIDCIGWAPAQIAYCTARLNSDAAVDER